MDATQASRCLPPQAIGLILVHKPPLLLLLLAAAAAGGIAAAAAAEDHWLQGCTGSSNSSSTGLCCKFRCRGLA
jgi:hypothetical protein